MYRVSMPEGGGISPDPDKRKKFGEALGKVTSVGDAFKQGQAAGANAIDVEDSPWLEAAKRQVEARLAEQRKRKILGSLLLPE